MSVAYVDTSCLVAIALDEPEGETTAARLTSFDTLVTSNLLEAELRSTFSREGIDQEAADVILDSVRWVLPSRPLHTEIGRALEAGYLRGADLWHIATALFLADDPTELPFVTLDLKQRQVARQLGFPPGPSD